MDMYDFIKDKIQIMIKILLNNKLLKVYQKFVSGGDTYHSYKELAQASPMYPTRSADFFGEKSTLTLKLMQRIAVKYVLSLSSRIEKILRESN